MKAFTFLLFILVCCVSTTTIYAKDIKGSQDHPMVSRYKGSKILKYSVKAFDEYNLFVAKANKYGGKAKNLNSTQTLEGKVTKISYQAPGERTTLEVYRNYLTELTNAKFFPIFECKNELCGGRNFNHSVAAYGLFGEDYEDQRFFSGKLKRSDGIIYVSLYVAMHNDGSKANNNKVRVQLDIIELKAMDTDMVVVDAEALAKGILSDGHIAIYSIYFDLDSAKLKPESNTAIGEIAKLLKQHSKLKLLVVGHTDNQGSLAHNKSLSIRRAAAVVNALLENYKIKASRLTADGVAYLAPVASNRTELGRSKNRRVELVESN